MSAFETGRRATLTAQQRAKLFVARGGRCHRCDRELRPGEKWTVEHLVALQNGGTNHWENLGITCAWCRPAKDAEDAALAAKGRRRATKHLVPTAELRYGRARPANLPDDSSHRRCERCRQVHLRPGYCQALAQLPVTHVTHVTGACHACGAPLSGRRKEARYCSAACRQRAPRKRTKRIPKCVGIAS